MAIEVVDLLKMVIFHNAKSGLVNIPLLTNLLLPKKRMQFKNRWSPVLIHTPDKKTSSAEIHVLSNNFYFQFYLFPFIFYIFFNHHCYA